MTATEITDDLFRRLHNRYTGKGVILLEQVGDGAGFGNSGWSDAIAMSTWPSKGLTLYGFEVKASRADWLRELDRPEKNAAWQACCHEWYIVAPKDVVKLEELPTDWGLLIPKGADGLRVAKRSEKEAEPVTLDLIAAVFRAADGLRRDMKNRMRDRIQEALERRYRDTIDAQQKENKRLSKQYHDLKCAVGDSWDSLDKLKDRAEALAKCDEQTLHRLSRQVGRFAETLERSAAELRSAAAKLEKPKRKRVRLG